MGTPPSSIWPLLASTLFQLVFLYFSELIQNPSWLSSCNQTQQFLYCCSCICCGGHGQGNMFTEPLPSKWISPPVLLFEFSADMSQYHSRILFWKQKIGLASVILLKQTTENNREHFHPYHVLIISLTVIMAHNSVSFEYLFLPAETLRFFKPRFENCN
jgi:hypothetical protein